MRAIVQEDPIGLFLVVQRQVVRPLSKPSVHAGQSVEVSRIGMSIAVGVERNPAKAKGIWLDYWGSCEISPDESLKAQADAYRWMLDHGRSDVLSRKYVDARHAGANPKAILHLHPVLGAEHVREMSHSLEQFVQQRLKASVLKP